jgi:hypothetical protein
VWARRKVVLTGAGVVVAALALAGVIDASTSAGLPRSDISTLEVPVKVSVCDAAGANCLSLGVPDAAVIVSGAGNQVAQGKTDDGGHLRLTMHYVGDVTVRVTSTLMAGGSVSTSEALSAGGSVSWTVLRPLASGFLPSPS